MPDNLYFRQPETQRMLLDILFIWSKLNPDIGYRQGMHEVLAPILWVVERDSISDSKQEISAGEPSLDNTISAVLDSQFICHDAFTLFCLIMQGLKSSFEPGAPANANSKSMSGSEQEAPIIRRSQRIVGSLLKRVDIQLSSHLREIDIVPQLFVMYVSTSTDEYVMLDKLISTTDVGSDSCLVENSASNKR